MVGKIQSINIGESKGGAKHPVVEARLVADWGLDGDCHVGPGLKQVSLLAWESALKMRDSGADVNYGSFGENITTVGLALKDLKIGDRLKLGRGALIEVTAIGKECPEPCDIFKQMGYCIMPTEGLFFRVIEGGSIRVGDPITLVEERLR